MDSPKPFKRNIKSVEPSQADAVYFDQELVHAQVLNLDNNQRNLIPPSDDFIEIANNNRPEER